MLEIKNLSFGYGKKQVLYDINLSINDGTFTAVIGLNGSGKSTFLSCIACLNSFSGSILLDDKDFTLLPRYQRATMLSYLPQSVKSVPFTALELVSMGRNPYKTSENKAKSLAKACLDELGLLHLSDKKVNEISGGERQLCYFATVLCQDADLMLLDEPANGMDIGNEEKIYRISKQRCINEGKTVIAVMHNLSNAVKYADNIIILHSGKAVFFGSKEKCLDRQAIEKHFGVKKYVCGDNGTRQIFFSKDI